MTSTHISEGRCRCIREPRGAHGMEGYDLGSSYRYEERKDAKGRYCRVYHSERYYESCGPQIFKKHFEIMEA